MIPMRMSQIAKNINAKLLGEDLLIEKVITDSRQPEVSGLFVAIKGPSFDAHDFAEEAVSQGANALLVERQLEINVPQLLVENSRLALAKLAAANRALSNASFVAITGSSGKTTVKEMVASILSLSGETLATKGNLNNEIGAPLSLLQVQPSTEFAVIELGASQAGDIAFTAKLTAPDVALVNNIGEAHLEGFGSLKGVAEAKAEIYASLSHEGIAIVNGDSEYADYFQQLIQSKMISFSVQGKGDVCADKIELSEQQTTHFTINYQQQTQQVVLPLLGEHNVANALAAASCCLALNIPLSQIAAGLSQIAPVKGRLNEYLLSNSCRLIDDTYNANLASVMAAIDLLANYSAPTTLVLGDLAELGEYGKSCHQKIGQYAAEKAISQLFTYGKLTQYTQQAFRQYKGQDNNKGDQIFHFDDQKKLIQQLQKEANAKQTILVKGSRSAAMEKVVTALKELDKNSQLEKASHSAETSIASLQGEH